MKKNLFRIIIGLAVVCLISLYAQGSDPADTKAKALWSVRIVHSLMDRNADTLQYSGDPKSARWDYERGVVLQGVYQLYLTTHKKEYLNFIKKHIDLYVQVDGSIRTYDYLSFNLDYIATGRNLLALYKTTKDKKYKISADTLRKQLAYQPRTIEGGFWHKKIYPFQMWLDGIYMAEPF